MKHSVIRKAHHELAGIAFLCDAVALRQRGEELHHALVLLKRRVVLKRLLDQPTQLLGLACNHTDR